MHLQQDPGRHGGQAAPFSQHPCIAASLLPTMPGIQLTHDVLHISKGRGVLQRSLDVALLPERDAWRREAGKTVQCPSHKSSEHGATKQAACRAARSP